MNAAVLLLCALWVPRADGEAEQSQACVSDHEVTNFVPADFLNASSPVSVEVCVGRKLNISLEGLSGVSACQWIKGQDLIMTINGSHSTSPTSLSEADSGNYILKCGASPSMDVHLQVIKRPTKPELGLDGIGNTQRSPYITCKSSGSPNPTMTWLSIKDQNVYPVDRKNILEGNKISSARFHDKVVMCCANNNEGEECSPLYDYELERNVISAEVSNVTVSPNQSLLLRCRESKTDHPVWEMNNRSLYGSTYECSTTVKKEMCIVKDKHYSTYMSYLFIESVNVNHSGIYSCRNKDKTTTKSVYVQVQEKGFISVQLDDNIILPAQNASRFCLEAQVSYHPVLQYCSWEAPDKTMTKCIRDKWVTMHRNVKRCGPLISGDYKLHLKAGERKETKTISVCVVDTPDFRPIEDDNTITYETYSLVPANYSWLSCSYNHSCEDSHSLWTEIPGTFRTDSDVLCNKRIESSLNKELANEQMLKFCLTNSVGWWCKTVNFTLSLSTKKHTSYDNHTALKIGLFVGITVLIVVTMMLMYFVKNKKPQYQPQLQMLQMVGPNNNDYIYINFKDFDYDVKWEFPRENLELGKELGAGAFGMVVQATAHGINKPGVSQQVAVKMLKEKHQTVEKEALMSELKMLIHIGNHANIVNLLGACTETGPIYLIFQYCCHGDLLNYLKSNSERYHKSVTDAFNKDRFRSIYSNPKLQKSELDTSDNYVPMHASTTRGQEELALLNLSSTDMGIYEGQKTEMFENPENQSDDLQALTFDDLLSFAFQVAKGMDFLSSRNCIHRDLAARNVLVTKGRVVKIGDFGLARDIDNDSNYVVRGNVRLPVKWMAPESIFQGMYTMKSDVWAYGILLWEIFSLGVTPYPGIKVDHTFYSMIKKGFKMECPYYATDDVYRMMCECWTLDPNNRPSFTELVSFMCYQLAEREEKLYHNVLNLTSSDYQNATAILDISALTKQGDNKTQTANDYCQTTSAEKRKAERCDSDTLADEKKLLKPPVVE